MPLSVDIPEKEVLRYMGYRGISDIDPDTQVRIDKAMEQSVRDARYDEFPTVMHRKNGKQWLVTMSLIDWMELFQAWEKNR